MNENEVKAYELSVRVECRTNINLGASAKDLTTSMSAKVMAGDYKEAMGYCNYLQTVIDRYLQSGYGAFFLCHTILALLRIIQMLLFRVRTNTEK